MDLPFVPLNEAVELALNSDELRQYQLEAGNNYEGLLSARALATHLVTWCGPLPAGVNADPHPGGQLRAALKTALMAFRKARQAVFCINESADVRRNLEPQFHVAIVLASSLSWPAMSNKVFEVRSNSVTWSLVRDGALYPWWERGGKHPLTVRWRDRALPLTRSVDASCMTLWRRRLARK
jgi:hypothetical protein